VLFLACVCVCVCVGVGGVVLCRCVYNKKYETGCVHVGRGAFTIQLVLSAIWK